MILYPEVQARAQKELDTVIGSSRLPQFEDWGSLPYVRSIVKETLRCTADDIVSAKLTTARESAHTAGYSSLGQQRRRIHGLSDPGRGRYCCKCQYLGLFQAFLTNFKAWTINNDPNRAPNPREFRPERYLNDAASSSESAAKANPADRDHFAFGSGRRICPGMFVADRNLFMAVSRMLWAFEIERGKDVHGNDIPIDPDAMTQGFVTGPVPYK